MQTRSEREAAFLTALQQLQQQFGLRLEASTQARQYGPATMIEPVLKLTPIEGWQPPGTVAPEPEPSDES